MNLKKINVFKHFRSETAFTVVVQGITSTDMCICVHVYLCMHVPWARGVGNRGSVMLGETYTGHSPFFYKPLILPAPGELMG